MSAEEGTRVLSKTIYIKHERWTRVWRKKRPSGYGRDRNEKVTDLGQSGGEILVIEEKVYSSGHDRYRAKERRGPLR